MVFNSLEYAVFLPTVVIVYWTLARFESLRFLWLLGASYFFYMSWDWRFASLILFTTVLNYICGWLIDDNSSTRIRRCSLIVSLIGSLGVLAFFKYYNFFVGSVDAVAESMGFAAPLPLLSIILPVGISFFTFQALSYTIDIYRGQLRKSRNFVIFALYIAFFPQLVAGPIVRATDFLPQCDRPPRYDDTTALRGLYLILSGLFKKVIIADVLAITLVDPAFASPADFSGFWLLVAGYAYSMQIYCDFSAYSDIAIGSAFLLGFKLPENFNRPFVSASITEFWRRWHISLSTWLRDYLYIPLGGNRQGEWKTYRNLMITMLLGGLWHGASWNFVVWGLFHGFILAVERLFFGGKRLLNNEGIPRATLFLRQILTFHLVCFSFMLFRAQPVGEQNGFQVFFTIMKRIIIGAGESECISGFSWWLMFALVLGYGFHFTPVLWKERCIEWYIKSGILIQSSLATVLLILFTVFGIGTATFIYFQF